MPTRISVVIPVYNAKKGLPSVLDSLALSTHPALECILADDCSTDKSVLIGLDNGAKVVNLPKRLGPAAARNRGASVASGEILLFIDADVCVHADTLERIAHTFSADPDVSALIGSYDEFPDAKDFLSQYRNLMHHYVHQLGHESASTFWSGCGAIRRSVFAKMSGFDES